MERSPILVAGVTTRREAGRAGRRGLGQQVGSGRECNVRRFLLVVNTDELEHALDEAAQRY
jgi:hypothetical protein